MAAGPPVVTYSFQQSILKEEDVILVNPSQQYDGDKSDDASSSFRSTELNGFSYRSIGDASASTESGRPASCGLFVVCDGHNGVTAAQYVADQLPAYLEDLLPPGSPPHESDAKAYLKWRQGLQRALSISLALLHRAFAGMGVLAGCTVTIVLQHDWLLTVANLGDSRAVVDTGRDVIILTDDHRVATNRNERRRLEKRGATIAPVDISGNGPAAGKTAIGVGPLRLWPGGLCLSRAIGDFDVGDTVLSLPYISQVKLPTEGARLLVASDGVWDAFEKHTRVCSIARSAVTQAVPTKIITAIVNRHDGIKDDTSVVVVDLLPPNKTFAECARSGVGVASCMCIGGSKREPGMPQPEVQILDSVDVAHLAGLMPEAPDQLPAWFTDKLCEDLIGTMEQAIEIWEQANSLRRVGKVPSIADFEKLLITANADRTGVHEAAAKAAAMDDMSVRMGQAGRAQKSIFPQSSSSGSMGDNPSVRFGNSVAASSEEFGIRFGHYGRQTHSIDGGPSHTRLPGSLPELQASPGRTAGPRTAFMEGRSVNAYAMKSYPNAAGLQEVSASDCSVRAGDAAGAGPVDFSVRQGNNSPFMSRRPAVRGGGVAGAAPADASDRPAASKKALPLTELQAATARPPDAHGNQRVRGGTSAKSVGFADIGDSGPPEET